MRNALSKEKLFKTRHGDVRLCSFCTSSMIRQYRLDGQFSTHAHYKSLYTKRDTLEEIAQQPDTNLVLALDGSDTIIGFGVLAYPDTTERWSDLGPDIMIEVKAIEVARSWRSGKIASSMLEMVLNHPLIEDKIAYMVGYSWTWDLEETEKTAEQYRGMLIRLFEPQGFQLYKTNEPNICLRPENLFICRIGKNISEAVLIRFKWLRFGLSPWTWINDGQNS
jgi:acetoin utilization protein AcuA